ncbi:hypothetical protein Poly41_23970 [Novipirellula artificiosorum]|uniref:Uncharacterized protein n=1 Tax=Novipirellula artificiosorum TaxID=2528016 RepID=A0A5C6DS88_9BACT|nr:hypothetical protein Poly41_23970 [Novipirellula artificiosorum]
MQDSVLPAEQATRVACLLVVCWARLSFFNTSVVLEHEMRSCFPGASQSIWSNARNRRYDVRKKYLHADYFLFLRRPRIEKTDEVRFVVAFAFFQFASALRL